ncbi:hypothetical protein KST10_06785 [Fusobacterium animalis]|uniref:Uncharacterized protein n=1 Tax=Fusobacterium animalis 7_1 TaxID=457405 RepID=A0A140PQR9_9FUSO|nr:MULTISPECIES: hypothetical protein [Fusobacterium]ASG31126.1 hypothetical protein CBG60_07835 [Fusobacterium animalis]EEO41814.1 hypothetical protein FSDG_00373 [Fusobacterium animalis 7_1]EGN64442.1 hypothetical protein HMPREF0404_01147 [Fusobacterium animalis 21_1A]EHG18561.2 hypothetical protein HMPREF9369_01395 [Fusobacterium polymorphum F0401]EUB34036.1 hypothetical protein HMPREF1498_1214 [Fusobacterium sp. CM1]
MTELEIKIIKFLLSSAVYSENAIMKNLGIDKNVLDKSLKILEDNGYLESYEEFIKREKLNEESDCCKTKKGKACSNCSSSSCNSCSPGSSCCDNNIFSDITDFSKIKVITMKAVDKFS